MDFLPEEIIRYIYDFVPSNVKCYLSAKNYKKYNKSHLKYLNNVVCGYHLTLNKKFTFDTFIRRIIKNDYYYIFNFFLKDNHKRWCKNKKKKRFKQFEYKSKLIFYSLYCVECKANKCLELIKNHSL